MKIVTWNILAQRYSQSLASWEDRLSQILDLINDLDADILCLQEVELATSKDDFQPLFEHYNHYSHQISKKRNNPIGNLTLWRKNNFTVHEQKSNSSAVKIVLSTEDSARKFQIINIHLKAGLYSKEDERIKQMQSVLKLSTAGVPACIVGDYNDDLSDERQLFKLLTNNGFMPHRSPGSCCVPSLLGYNFFSFDHISLNPDTTVRRPGNSYSLDEPIPNETFPSDHYYVTFLLDL